MVIPIYNSRNSKDLIVLSKHLTPDEFIYNSRNSKDLIVLRSAFAGLKDLQQ